MNRTNLTGRLTKDIDLQKTQNGISVCNFTLAVSRQKKEDGADFIQCQAWKAVADYLSQYGHKGSMLELDGRIQTRNYTNKDGFKVYITEVVAEHLRIIGGFKADTEQNQYEYEQDTVQGEMPY